MNTIYNYAIIKLFFSLFVLQMGTLELHRFFLAGKSVSNSETSKLTKKVRCSLAWLSLLLHKSKLKIMGSEWKGLIKDDAF